MLVALRVQSFILIESLELRLEPGFNVLTGETGAGKSIVIGALGLVLGGRARADMVRPGADEASVEALFDLGSRGDAPDDGLRVRLEAMGITADDELSVRRIVLPSGRSRAYLNGRLCSVAELSSIATSLADITSQHASVALSDPSHHLDYLDRWAKLVGARDALAHVVDALREVVAELAALREVERDRAKREDFLRYQLETIDALAPQPGELAALESERNRLKHAARLSQTSAAVAAGLDDDGALLDRLGKLVSDLDGAASVDDTLSPLACELEDCWSRLRDVARDIARYAETIESDPQRLEQVQERAYRLEQLLRRHGPTIEDLLATREAAERELETLAGADDRIAALGEQRGTLLADAGREARRLSKRRKRAARELGQAISNELGMLGMGTARVVVEVSSPICKRTGDDGDLLVDDARLGRDGIDRAQFLIAPNKGVEPRPLSRIASGGELSRALLALKRALYAGGGDGENSHALQVFDEVDSGVGGATADCIGRAIADIARHRQVLCITHLASIAAHASAHFVVEKRHGDDATTSTIERVEGTLRVAELARMLTGAKVTGPARRAAAQLLASVRADGDAGVNDAAE
jgi:DNA repair protein RecN (Recombination protein N)